MIPLYFSNIHYSEIPNLDEELINHLKEYYFTTKLISDFGFKTHSNYWKVYLNKDKGLVIKSIYISYQGKMLDKVPALAVPTYYVSDFHEEHLVIQPIVDTSNEAVDFVNQYRRTLSWNDCELQFGPDSHDGNIGLYQGKPAVFDW
jgi:hypothetical protein